jgi:WD40 repeat protein
MFLRERQSRQGLEKRAYLSDMNAAARSAVIRVGGLAGAAKLLDSWNDHQPDPRGWEWYYLSGLCHQEILTIQADNNELWSVAWSPDGRRLATGGSDGALKLWDATTGQHLSSFPVHDGAVRCVAWSPDGRWLASSGEDRTITIRDLDNGSSRVLDRGEDLTPSLAWSADGKRLASGTLDGLVRIWDPLIGNATQTLAADNPVNAVCWNGDGSRIFACGPRGIALAWDSSTGSELWKSNRRYQIELLAAACSPDGRELVTGGVQNAVNFLNATTGEALASLFDNQNAILALAWSADGTRLASATRGDGRIAIRDARAGGAIIREFRGHLGSVRSIAWQPGGTRIASASTDGTVRIWDPAAPNPSTLTLKQPGGALALEWSPDGTRIAVGTHRTHAWIRDFNLGGAPITLDTSFWSWSYAVAWSPDGTRLISAGRDGVVVFDPASRRIVWQDRTSNREIRSVAWNPEGTRIAAVNKTRQLTLWEAAKGKPLKTLTLPPGETGTLAWSPDGHTLATGVGNTIHLWDSRLRPLRTLPGHPEGITALAWNSDSTRLASAGGDASVKLWNPENGTLRHNLLGHGAPVHGLAWSPDGTRLATGSWDMSLKIWDTASGVEACAFDQPGGIVQMIAAVAWSPDGCRIAVSDIEGIIGILDATPGWPMPSPASEAGSPSDPDQARAETIRSLRTYCEAVEPHAAGDADALRRLAWIRATAPYPEIRDGKKAVAFATEASDLVGGTSAGMLRILAAAQAEAGDFESAIATQQQAISLLRHSGEYHTRYTAALKLYESRQPCRDDSW